MVEFLDEILLHVFEYLSAFNLTRVSAVCKQWRDISRSSSLWRKLLLRRWPSQTFLFGKVPLSCVNWMRTYQELAERGKFSSDEMKYLVSCRAAENELLTHELRSAMFHRMAEVVVKWKAVEPIEDQNHADVPDCNRNLELLYDTRNLKWVFIDKRRGCMLDESLFSSKARAFEKSKTVRYVRSYQVMASCLAMYRWLCLFRPYTTREVGLTFYRIWRYRLRHRSTGLIFEVFDWKAAMSNSLSNGCPNNLEYKEDCLELMDLLAHPNFIMHPMGLSPFYKMQRENPIERMDQTYDRQMSEVPSLPLSLPSSRSPSISSIPSNSDLEELVPPDSPTASQIPGSTDSDDESESEQESGYVINCNYFICTHHWDVEEQHTIQASVAEQWSVSRTNFDSQLSVVYDPGENSWKLQSCCEPDMFPIGEKLKKHISTSEECSGSFLKAIPSCLALYRLLCLVDLNAEVYVNLEESSVWVVHLRHNQTSSILHLKDINGAY